MSKFDNYSNKTPNILVIIDSKVDNYHTLISGINLEAELVILNPEKNGIEQITLALLQNPSIKSIQIICHGQPGYLYLGNSSLNYYNIQQYTCQLSQWSEILGKKGEILLYSCQVAQGQIGQEFVEYLHRITNINIAASNSLTGSQKSSGNWDLEIVCGKIVSVLAFDLNTIKNYAGVLASTTLSTGTGDGSISITLDPLGVYGDNSDNGYLPAYYDPIGATGSTSLVFSRDTAFRFGSSGSRTWFSSLADPVFTSTSATSATSQFNLTNGIDTINVGLNQIVNELIDGGIRTGSVLLQTFSLTNPSASSIYLELITYMENDVSITNSFQDGGGLLTTTSGEKILFQTDVAGDATSSSDFIGISVEGGTPLAGEYEIGSYDGGSGLGYRIEQGISLSNTVVNDSNGDSLVDTGADTDIGMAYGSGFTINPGQTITYVVKTIFGQGQLNQVPVINISPTANNDSAATFINQAVTANITNNDNDPDGNITGIDINPSLSNVQNTFTSTQGSYSINSSGQVVFTPNNNFTGTATLPYQVIDNSSSTSNIATLNIVVNNQNPSAIHETINSTVNKLVTTNIRTNDTDPDTGNFITGNDIDVNQTGIQNTFTNSQGTFSIDGTGQVIFTPVTNFTGTAQLPYQAVDNLGLTSNNTATLNIVVNNQNPTAVSESNTATVNNSVTTNIRTNDTDPDTGNFITGNDIDVNQTGIQSTFTNSQGTFSIDGTGQVIFTPVTNFTGTALLPYQAVDNLGLTSNNTATLNIVVNNQNSTAVSESNTGTVNNSVTTNIRTNDTDPDTGNIITGNDIDINQAGIQNTFTNSQGTFSIDGNGQVIFTPVTNFTGTAQLPYQAVDNLGLTSNNTATLSVIVNNQNPIANSESTTATVNNSVTTNIRTNDTDPDTGNIIMGNDIDINQTGIQNTFTNSQGTFSIDGNGQVIFTPVTNFTGTAQLPYQAVDNLGLTSNNIATLSVIVNNQNPTAVSESTTATVNNSVTTNIRTNDTDPDTGNIITGNDIDLNQTGIQNTFTNSQGTFSIDGSGQVVFTPVTNFTGTATLPYQAVDNLGLTSNNIATLSVIVNNQNPIANSESNTATVNNAVTTNIRTNDTDPDTGNIITGNDIDINQTGIQNTFTNSQGTFSIDGTGQVIFTPVTNFTGTAQLPYQAIDNLGLTSNNTATLSVIVSNQNPIANSESNTATVNNSVTTNIRTNDTDPDTGNIITGNDLDVNQTGIQNTFTNNQGTFSINGTGQVIFTPVTNFTGTAELPYQAVDNLGLTSNNTATLSVIINNQNPTAVSESTTATVNNSVTTNIRTNDTDPDTGNIITGNDIDINQTGIQNTFTNSQGTFSIDGNGQVIFTPVTNFTGTAQLPYQAVDNLGLTSNNIATLSVIVNNQNPTAVSESNTATVNNAVTTNIRTNDTDSDTGNFITGNDIDINQTGIQNTFTNSQGTFSIDGSGQVVFTPVTNFTGTAQLPYQAVDNLGLTSNNTATLNIVVNNQNPTAVSESNTATVNNSVTTNIRTNDTDPDTGNFITGNDIDINQTGIQNTFTNSQGTFSIDGSGQVIFTPVTNFTGTAQLPYQAVDNLGLTSNNTATLSVIVNNQNPIANSESTTATVNNSVTTNIRTNDTDPDTGNIIMGNDIDINQTGIQNTFTNSQGTFSIDGNGQVIFTPVTNFTGTAQLPYQAVDNLGLTSNNIATLSVIVNNQNPIANSESNTATVNNAVTTNIRTNDTDPDTGNIITGNDIDLNQTGIQNTFTNSQGTFSIDGSGQVIFTPVTNFTGTAQLPYQAVDNLGLTSNNTATLSVIVNNQNPIANSESTTATVNNSVTTNIRTNDTDPDTGNIIMGNDIDINQTGIQNTFTNSQGTFSIDGNGQVIFTPVTNFTGTAQLPYQAVDNLGLTSNNIATLSVIVNNQNPTAVSESNTATVNNAVTTNIRTNDTDSDTGNFITGNDLNPGIAGIQNTFTNSQGTFSIDGSGQVIFTPVTNFTGTAELPYQAVDNLGLTSNNTATLSVIVSNQNPTAVSELTTATVNNSVTTNIRTNDADPNTGNIITGNDIDINQTGIQNTFTNSQGTFSIDGTGQVIFTPVTNFTGTALLPYQAVDNLGLTSNNTATLSVIVNNQNPIANIENITANVNNSVTTNIRTNDTDPDTGNFITGNDIDINQTGIQNTFTNSQGTFSIDGTGQVIFTPVTNFTGTAQLPYQAIDNLGLTSNNTATLSVIINNQNPTAVSELTTATVNNSVTTNIRTNDADPNTGNIITGNDIDINQTGIQNTFTNSQGTFSIDGTGQVIFTPVTNFTGTAQLPYQAIDNLGLTSNNTATLSVIINNQNPTAVSELTTATVNNSVTTNIRTNDADPDTGNFITGNDIDINQTGIQNTFINSQGTFSIDGSSQVIFTPVTNFTGTAQLPYQAVDNLGLTSNNTATLNIVVNNQNPTAVSESTTATVNNSVTTNIRTNDTDPDTGNIITGNDIDVNQADIQNTFTNSQGTFSIDGSGQVIFTPVTNFTGTATLPYQAVDNLGLTSNNTATLSVIVSNQNPSAVSESNTATVNNSVTTNIRTNDTDPDTGNIITGNDIDLSQTGIQDTFTNSQGTFSIDGNGQVVFTPVTNFTGTAELPYQAVDNLGLTYNNTATLSIIVSNQNPTAVSESNTATVNNPVTTNIRTNDTDPDTGNFITGNDIDVNQTGIQDTFTNSQGTFSIDGTGQVIFTPVSNFTGTAQLPYQAVDNLGLTSNNTATLNIIVSNQNPVANNDTGNTEANQSVTINIASNDSDADGNITAFDLNPNSNGIQNTISNSQGVFSVNNNGQLLFTPASDFTGTATLPYQAVDNLGLTSNNTATLNIVVSNENPVANNDTGNTEANQSVTLNIATNDNDPDGNITGFDLNPNNNSIQNTFSNNQGAFSVNNNGQLVFTPNSDFIGTATLQYQAIDNIGATSNIANISINVTALPVINQSPIAGNDSANTQANQSVTLNIATNDNDIDGNITGFDLNPNNNGIQNTFSNSQGLFSVNNNRQLVFTPASDFTGTATLQYQAVDNTGATSNIADITINVTELPVINENPVANNDSTNTEANQSVTINIASNDSDADGNITGFDLNPNNNGIQNTISNSQGVFSVNHNGQLIFTPANNFTGTATLQYQAIDNAGATSNIADISIDVTELPVINQNPVASNDSANTQANQSVTLNILNNDSDLDGNITGFDLNPNNNGIQNTISNSQGVFSVNHNGQLIFTPANNFTGTATLQYQAIDNIGATSNIANISINVTELPVINQNPIAGNDSANTEANQSVTLNIATNDNDPDGNITGFDLNPNNNGIQNTISNSQGVFSVNNNGQLIFTPANNFTGIATLQYQVIDNAGATSNIADININVTELPVINQNPIAGNDSGNTEANQSITLNILNNDSDIDGNITGFDLNPNNNGIQNTISNSQGVFSVDNNGQLVFTPANNFTGTATLQYQAIDNLGATSNIADISIDVTVIPIVNQNPIAGNDSGNTEANQSITLNILNNDSDPDGNITGFDLNPNNNGIQNTFSNIQGLFSVNNNGQLVFTPASDFTGTATLQYQAIDNIGATSNIANISINVTELPLTNQNPVANNDTGNTEANQSVTINIANNDSDADGNITAFDLNPNSNGIQNTFSNNQGIFSVNNNGQLIFTPANNFTGTATLQYQAIDNAGATSNIANISINVTELPIINQNPIAGNDSGNTKANQSITLNILNNDSDTDGNITGFDLNPNNNGIQNTISNNQGIFSVNNNGQLIFTPANNFTGIATLQYQAIDNIGATSNIANISINVTVIPDNTIVPENPPITIDIEIDDSDDTNTITSIDLDPNQPGIQNNIDFNIPEGLVSINGTGENNQPGIFSFTAQGIPTGSVIIPLPTELINNSQNQLIDLDPNQPGIQNVLITTQGLFSLDQSNNLVFRASDNFTGTATLAYQLIDRNIKIDLDPTQPGEQNSISIPEGTLSIDINNTVQVTPNQNFTGQLLLNNHIFNHNSNSDFDLDPTLPGRQSEITLPQGVFQINSQGDLIFTPVSGFTGTVTLPYQIFNQSGKSQNSSIRLNINPTDGNNDNSNNNNNNNNQNNSSNYTPPPPVNNNIPNNSNPKITSSPTPAEFLQCDCQSIPNILVLQVPAVPSPAETMMTIVDNQILGTEQADILISITPNLIVDGLADHDLLFGNPDITTLFGNTGNDTLVSLGTNILFGNRGDDILHGSTARDSVYAGKDNDWLNGYDNNDWLSGERGNDSIIGGVGDDLVYGGKDNDLITGDAGNDWLSGDKGTDSISGGDGDDTIYATNSNRVNQNTDNIPLASEYLNGDLGNDLIFGGDSTDQLCGDEGDDQLCGNSGNDSLCGGSGNDWLVGDHGDDTIITGIGDDQILLQINQGTDLIGDFDVSSDRFVLPVGVTFNQLSFIQSDLGTVITYQGNNLVTIYKINSNQLNPDLFKLSDPF